MAQANVPRQQQAAVKYSHPKVLLIDLEEAVAPALSRCEHGRSLRRPLEWASLYPSAKVS
jgi:hypothetical protein